MPWSALYNSVYLSPSFSYFVIIAINFTIGSAAEPWAQYYSVMTWRGTVLEPGLETNTEIAEAKADFSAMVRRLVHSFAQLCAALHSLKDAERCWKMLKDAERCWKGLELAALRWPSFQVKRSRPSSGRAVRQLSRCICCPQSLREVVGEWRGLLVQSLILEHCSTCSWVLWRESNARWMQ